MSLPSAPYPHRMVALPVSAEGRGFTYADLESLPPEDHVRYELSNGTLVVTPAANTRHQAILAATVGLLIAAKLPSQVILAEAELLLAPDVVKRPDVQVVHSSLVGGQYVAGTPELVVEIHSRSSRILDTTEKRVAYGQHRIGCYWLIDPAQRTLTVLELVGGEYQVTATMGPGDTITVSRPFPMTISPSDLLL